MVSPRPRSGGTQKQHLPHGCCVAMGFRQSSHGSRKAISPDFQLRWAGRNRALPKRLLGNYVREVKKSLTLGGFASPRLIQSQSWEPREVWVGEHVLTLLDLPRWLAATTPMQTFTEGSSNVHIIHAQRGLLDLHERRFIDSWLNGSTQSLCVAAFAYTF